MNLLDLVIILAGLIVVMVLHLSPLLVAIVVVLFLIVTRVIALTRLP